MNDETIRTPYRPYRPSRILACAALGLCLGACSRPAWKSELATPPAAAAAPLFATPSAVLPPATTEAKPQTGAEAAKTEAQPLQLTVADSVVMSLKNNRAFAVERYKPAITSTAEDVQRAVFDPVLDANASYTLQRQKNIVTTRVPDPSDPAGTTTRTKTDWVTGKSADASLSATQQIPTGTSVQVSADTAWREKPVYDSTRLGLSVTQALLRGYGTDANLASLRQARLDTQASAYELRGFAQDLVAQVSQAYWDYVLAKRQIAIVDESLALAEQQLAETSERINVGQLAEVERASAEAEVASRRETRINTQSNLATTRLNLTRLLGAPWSQDIDCLDTPTLPTKPLDDVEDHARLALRSRPDLNQARLQILRGDLELVKTRNGLLPKLDAFINLGKSGYANSFKGTLGNLPEEGYDAQFGLTGELPWGNRSAKAKDRSAMLGKNQSEESLANLTDLAQVDVRSAHIDAQRLLEQIAATAATRKFREESLRGETEKFRVGRSTNLLVAQAQRDLLQSRVLEVEAAVNYLKAVVELYRRDGSLLTRMGIEAPGVETVEVK